MPLTMGQTLALLAETPRRIAELTRGLSAAQLRTAPAAGEWSANEVLARLRACADVRGGAALTIVAEARPTFRAIDPRRWIESTDYRALLRRLGRPPRAAAREAGPVHRPRDQAPRPCAASPIVKGLSLLD